MDSACLYGWNVMENVQKKPEIIVFAGPNGSGKSTFTEILRPPQMDYINADEIKKNLKETLINSFVACFVSEKLQ